jgi:uncharacterized membrane protein YesL
MKETKLHRALSWAIDLVFAGLLWTVCSLPVVTLGASSAALYYAVVKCVRHERGTLYRVFFEGFRSNFRAATRLWLAYLLAAAIGAANVTAARQLAHGDFSPFVALAGIIFLPLALTLPWVFACVSRFENSFAGSLKFIGYLAASNPLRSLLLALELGLVLLIAWLTPQIAPLLPGAAALLLSLGIEPVFRRYTDDGSAGDDAWYNE